LFSPLLSSRLRRIVEHHRAFVLFFSECPFPLFVTSPITSGRTLFFFSSPCPHRVSASVAISCASRLHFPFSFSLGRRRFTKRAPQRPFLSRIFYSFTSMRERLLFFSSAATAELQLALLSFSAGSRSPFISQSAVDGAILRIKLPPLLFPPPLFSMCCDVREEIVDLQCPAFFFL